MAFDKQLNFIISAVDKATWPIKNVSSKLRGLSDDTKKSTQSMNMSFSTIANWIAAIWALEYGRQMITWMVKVTAALEQQKIAFTTMLGSADAAAKMLDDLSNFAAKTPFEIDWIRQNAKQLLAMGIWANDIIPTLKSLWDVSAWLSVPLDRLALAYWQVIAKGKLQWWELKQFTEAWVPLIATISKTLWVTSEAFYKMVEDGQISSDQVVAAFQKMSSEWWQFANLMDAQSKTLWWLWSNLRDSFTQLWEKLWTSILPNLSEAVNLIISLFNTSWPWILWQALDSLNEKARWSSSTISELQSQIDKLVQKYQDGKISSSEYSSQMDILTDAIVIQKWELSKIQDQIDKNTKLQSIATDISWKYRQETDRVNKAIDWLNVQVAENTKLYNDWAISAEELKNRNWELYWQLWELRKWLSNYWSSVDNTRIIIDAMASSTATASQTKAYFDAIKISNGWDISRLNAEQKAAYALWEEYVVAYRKKLLMAKTEAAANVASLANKRTTIFWMLTLNKSLVDTAQTEFDKAAQAVDQFDSAMKSTKESMKILADTTNLSTKPIQSAMWWIASSAGWAWKAVKETADKVKEAAAEMKKATEEENKKIKEVIDSMQSTFKDAFNSIGWSIDWQKSKLQSLKDEIRNIRDEIKGISQDINDTQAQWASDIASRAATIMKEIDKLRTWDQTADTQGRIDKLNEELTLAKQNVSDEQIKQAEALMSRNETQVILDRMNARVVELEEKRRLLKVEYEEKKVMFESEKQAYQTMVDQKKQIDDNYFAIFGSKIEKQKKSIEETIKMMQNLAGTWPQLDAWLVNFWSQGQATQSSWSNSVTVNLWGVTVNNEADENRLVQKIKEMLIRDTQLYNYWIPNV